MHAVANRSRVVPLLLLTGAALMSGAAAAGDPPARNDLDGDGRSDILWWNAATGALVYWRAARADRGVVVRIVGDSYIVMRDHVPRATLHFYDWASPTDKGPGIVLQHRASGAFEEIFPEENGSLGTYNQYGGCFIAPTLHTQWQIHAGDFDGDNWTDAVFHDPSSGAVWFNSVSTWCEYQSIATVTSPDWRVAGVGDLDGDNASDLLWRHLKSGALVVWPAGRPAGRYPLTRVANLDWNIAGLGDFNGDGRSDILWRNSRTGVNTYWRSGDWNTRKDLATVHTGWRVAAVGDYNGDGRSDIFWRHTTRGANTIWLSADPSTRQAVATLAAHPDRHVIP